MWAEVVIGSSKLWWCFKGQSDKDVYSAVLGPSGSEKETDSPFSSFTPFKSSPVHVTQSDWHLWFLTGLFPTAWYRHVVPSTKMAFKPLVVKFLCGGSVRRPQTDGCHCVLSLGSATCLSKQGTGLGKIFVLKCMLNKCQTCYAIRQRISRASWGLGIFLLVFLGDYLNKYYVAI